MKKVFFILMIMTGLLFTISIAQAVEPILIGYNDIRSGPFKANGDAYILGIQTASKIINEDGGILGRPIKIVEEDNQMKPQIALQKLKKLILKDKVDVIFGGGTSASAIAISNAMPRYKKIFMPAGFALDLTGKNFNPYVFRPNFNVAISAKAMAWYIGEHTPLRKVYLINQDYSYGHDVADIYEKFSKKFLRTLRLSAKISIQCLIKILLLILAKSRLLMRIMCSPAIGEWMELSLLSRVEVLG